MDDFELTALDTLQHGLTRDAEKAHCLVHGEGALRPLIDKASAQSLGQANAPRSCRGQLLTADEAVIEPAMDGRGGDSEYRCRLFDRQQLALRDDRGRLEARDVPLPSQTAHMVGGKAVTVSGLTILTVENTGDDGVWVMRGQTANERDCVLVGAHDPGFWRGRSTSISARLPPRHRRVRRARCSALNTATITSSSSVRSSSLRSRAVVVDASHTLCKSAPSASRRRRSSALSARGR